MGQKKYLKGSNMHLVAAIVLYFSISQVLQAAEMSEETVGNTHKLGYNNQLADIELIVIDDTNKKHKFDLHSHILKDSKYFRLNFLQDQNLKDTKQYVFHTPSMAVFKKVVGFMYGAPVEFDSHEQFLAVLLLQEFLEIKQLDDILLAAIENNIEIFTTQYLIKILTMAYMSHKPFGEKCSESILKYIALYHDKQGNCSRSNLVACLHDSPFLVQAIDEAIARNKKEVIVPKKMPQVPLFEQSIHKKARKIYHKNKEVGSFVSVSRSMADTEKVVSILKTQYNISTNFTDRRKGPNNKYRIKITG